MSPQTETFTTVGAHQWQVPEGVFEVDATLLGAEGGGPNDTGGLGGETVATLPVSPGETLEIVVGAAGANASVNGAGSGSSGTDHGDGGDATDIRQGGTTLSDRVLVAGGGGGGTLYSGNYYDGGAGGGQQGGDGAGGSPGEGGTQNAGGAGGFNAEAGSFGVGGDAGGDAGGGGSGWYGGGGGGGSSGGAGSGYVDDAASGTTSSGVNSGDGEVTLEYEIEITPTSDLSVVGDRDTELDLEWTPADGPVDGQRIYRDTTAGVDTTSTMVADVGPDVSSHTDTDLDHGTTYYYAIEAYDDSGDADPELSNEADGTTTLPDIQSFLLDGTEPQEMRAEWDEILNTGRYRIRWKRSTDSSYDPADEATVASGTDPLEYTMTSLLDGEEYDVGIRTETDDAAGTYHTATEITKLIPASDITAAASSQTSLTVGWTLNSDFDGSQQVWRRREGYEYSDPKGELIGTVDSTTTEFEDPDDHPPDRDFEYTIRATTQYVYADGSGTLTTDSAGLAQSRAGSRGWHVEIDHPDGQTITPQILDDATVEPRLLDQPRVRIPVPKDDSYLSESLEGATMRVFKDGRQQPIDELGDVVDAPDRSVLVGIGGTQLERRVQVDVGVREAHILAGELIESESDYVANVDEPVVDSLENELLQEASTTDEIEEYYQGEDHPFVAADGLEQTQTLFTRDAGRTDEKGANGGDIADPGIGSPNEADWPSAGVYRSFTDAGTYLEFYPFDLEHRIPEDAVAFAHRSNGVDHELEVAVIDEETGTVVGSTTLENDTVSGLDWAGTAVDQDGLFTTGEPWTDGDLGPGTYQLRVTAVSGSGETRLDLVCLFDARYDYTWDNTLHEAGGFLDGPELYPDAASTEFVDAETIYSVRSGAVTSVWNDTSGSQALEVSNDGGRTWLSASNTETLDQDFGELGNTIRLRITASRWSPDGARDEMPRYGYAGQRMESYELRADMDDTPLIINQSYDTDLKEILTEIAERSDSIWAVQQDGDQSTIEWCQPGQRTSADADAIADYEVTKHSKRTYKATIKGGRSSERETVSAVLGEDVELLHDNVIPGTESVRDAETGERYEFNRDYDIKNATGDLEAVAAGNINDGQELEVEYDYKISGEYAADEFDGDRRAEMTETIAELSTVRGCEMAAKILVDEASVPRWEADVQIPPGDLADISLVEAFDVDLIPGERLVVYETDISADGAQLRLGSRDRVRDSIESIRSTLSAATDRV